VIRVSIRDDQGWSGSECIEGQDQGELWSWSVSIVMWRWVNFVVVNYAVE